METYERLSGFLDKYPNFDIGINTLFSAANQDRIYEIIDFVNGLDNIKTHTVSLVRGDLENEDFKKIDLSQYCKVIESMEKNLKKNVASTYRFSLARFKAAQDIVQRRMIHKTLEMQKRLIPCYAGRVNIVMSETGDIYPCEILDAKMGNVRDYNYDIGRLLRSKDSEAVKKRISSNGCFCSHECYLATNILFNPRMYGELFREYLQIL
jgi:radical SAM protein with 4Fe4S-binding SPASM domain